MHLLGPCFATIVQHTTRFPFISIVSCRIKSKLVSVTLCILTSVKQALSHE